MGTRWSGPLAPGTFPCAHAHRPLLAIVFAHAGNTPHTPEPGIFRRRTPRPAAPPTKTPATSLEFASANPSTARVAGSSSLSFLPPASCPPLRTTPHPPRSPPQPP